MTIIRKLANAIHKKSKYAQHWTKAERRPVAGGVSRQQIRRDANRKAFAVVSEKNPAMPRRERRRLARAYAVPLWSNALSKLADLNAKAAA